METGSSIINYQGNAELGLGSNSAIPVSAEKSELTSVNKAMDDFRLFDHQNNIVKYNQKIKDRDTALQMLQDGKVEAGKILPEDQKYYDEAEAKQVEAYKAIKGIYDKDGISKYLEATKNLKDVVTNTSHRWLEITKLETEKAAETLPEDQAAYDKHIKNEKGKGLHELITPYQKSHKLDLDGLNTAIVGSQMLTKGLGGDLPVAPPTKTETVIGKDGKKTEKIITAPSAIKTRKAKTNVTGSGSGLQANGTLSIYSETPEQYYDLGEMEKISDQLYLNNPKQAENIRETFKQFHFGDAALQENLLTAYNKRIAEYIQQTGAQPDANGNYKEFIRAEKMPDGKFLLRETPATFAAKQALASIQGDYIVKSQKILDEKAFKLNLEAAKNKGEIMLMGAKAQTERAKGAWYWKKAAGVKDEKEQTKMLEDGYAANLYTQPKLVTKMANGGYGMVGIPNQMTTPLFTWGSKPGEAAKPTVIKPIGSREVINPQTLEKSYVGGYYKQEYVYEGKAMDVSNLQKMYDKFNIDYTPEQRKELGAENFDDYLKQAIKANIFEVKMVGENGSTNKNFHTQAFKKALGSNKGFAEFFSEQQEKEEE